MKHFIRHISSAATTIFIAVTLVFFAIRLVPGDPIENILGEDAPRDQIEKLPQKTESVGH